MKNIFTIDTEDWYHANYQEGLFENKSNMQSTVEKNVDTFLEIFEKYNIKATFFVLGYVAEQHPDMIRKIAAAGHEIASHGYAHQLVYKQSKEEFREDIRKSKVMLEDILGQPIVGYRAPSWSITENSLWALPILEEEGFLYTSSIFPTKNYMYGIPYAPRFVHDSNIYGFSNLRLIHVPPTTKKVIGDKFAVPFSGGAYFRFLPKQIINYWTKQINKAEDKPVVFYLHPREIDPKQPRLNLKMKDAFIHYYGITGCEKKLLSVLENYEFETISSYLGLNR